MDVDFRACIVQQMAASSRVAEFEGEETPRVLEKKNPHSRIQHQAQVLQSHFFSFDILCFNLNGVSNVYNFANPSNHDMTIV